MRLVRGSALASVVAAAAAAVAGAQAPDPGSAQVTSAAGGFAARTSTTDGGRLRCIEVDRLGVRSCASARLKEGALVIGHHVRRREGRRPGLGRLVVAGLAGRSATRVRVRWRGVVRSMRPRRFGAYLAVFPRRARQRGVVISARHRDGSVSVIDFRRTRPRSRPLPGSDRVELRTVDPSTGRPLGLLVWRAERGQTCHVLGDLLGGRVGNLRGTSFVEYPINDGGSCVRASRLTQPLAFGVTTSARRTVVSGVARADVAAVELHHEDGSIVPLRVSRRRAFAHVLRGEGGPPPALTLVAVLRDGRRVTHPATPPR